MTRRCEWGLAAAVAALAMVLTGCAVAETRSGVASPSTTSRTSVGDPAPVRVAVVGDSNSTGFRGTLEAGVAGGAAWVALLPPERFVWAGGWAQDGATTTIMADNTPAIDADLLVIMGGTNDLAYGVGFERSAGEIARIADRSDVALVAVAAIAPFDVRPDDALVFNDQLSQLAADHGWIFLDPWRELRTAEGTWADAYLTDGVHTSPVGYGAAAAEIARQLTDHID